jgi:VIT1/CCC1 family predicted Fe2+/Mn2+ transporter
VSEEPSAAAEELAAETLAAEPAADESPDDEPIDHEHGDPAGGWLRPAVFGAMDGLVSNFALIAGVAGGTRGDRSHEVVLAGLAGLAAGAFSMAAGEYTSVASQSEFAQAEIETERREILRRPKAEEAELAELYIERGIERTLAEAVAKQVHEDPERAVAIHSREEFGADPDNLPNPLVAAVSSFVSFAIGAALPILPFLLGSGSLLPSMVISLVALFGCGALVSRVTVRTWWYGGLRQLLLGGAAAGLTYLIGQLVGASLN